MNRNILTIVVPVVTPLSHLETLLRMLNRSRDLPIEIKLVLDSESEVDYSHLIQLVHGSGNSRVELKKEKFNSAGLARNSGLEDVSTPWVAFWDADDFPEPGEYLEMIKVSEKAQTDLCIGSYETLDFQSHKIVQRVVNPTREYDWLVNPGLWRCVFKTSFLNEIKFAAIRMGEDIQFLAEIISGPTKWSFHEPVVYRYVINRAGQATSKKPSADELLTAFSNLVSISQKESSKNFALSMIICSRLATIGKNPSTYLGTARILGYGFFSGKLRITTFASALVRVSSIKSRQKGV
jgi:glycosyltransferase involved in cell wall biosynthesis